MAQSSRQSELFAGEVWQTLYSSFTQINFNASDPASISLALRSYVQANYPENFNDWIESSEFVTIIDLLSWLAGTLAFKTDIAARENFLSTAEARESILRLARFLSYNAARNTPATGVLKLLQVSTNDDVYNSFGTDLANTTILWNDPDDANWQENFNTVLNAAFVSTNPFGIPLKEGTVAAIETQLYRINAYAAQNALGFSAATGGTTMAFEVCNGDFADGGSLTEQIPNPINALNIYYLSDGNGNASTRTGYFMLFKQGTTQTQTTYLSYPVENQVIDVGATGVNNTDVWVQTVDDSGTVITQWTQVPVMLDSNVTYNNLPITERNIFSVITRDNDQISIRFSDGRFGNAPSGNIKVTYRVSNGLRYTINPTDIDLISLPITYLNAQGSTKTLTLTFSLVETVANANSAESIDDIRTRAPMVYATQNRMVSGEDYNSFPLKENLAVKIKAVNRVYSGHSRYFDLNDPTGTYQDLSIYADDGIFITEQADGYVEIYTTLNSTSGQVIDTYLQPMLSSNEATNAARETLLTAALNGTITVPGGMTWVQSNASLYSSTGYLSVGSALVKVGSSLKVTLNGVPTWVAVTAISGSMTSIPALNTAGPVTLSAPVPTGTAVLTILPPYTSTLPQSIVSAIEAKITNKLSFSLAYNYAGVGDAIWQVNTPVATLGVAQITVNATAFTMMEVDYLSGMWRVSSRGREYVFESITTIEWFDNGARAIDQKTGQGVLDSIAIMRFNEDLNAGTGRGLTRDYKFTIDKIWNYPNGAAEPRRTKVVLADTNDDGYPDDPDTLLKIISNVTSNSYLFWAFDSDSLIEPFYTMTAYATEAELLGSAPVINQGNWNAATNQPPLAGGTGTLGHYYTVTDPGATVLDGVTIWNVGDVVVFNGERWVKGPVAGTTVAFAVSSPSANRINAFWDYTSTGWVQDFTDTYVFGRGRGPNTAATWTDNTGTVVPVGDQLAIHWKHYAPSNYRIDPASQNIHDIFVLTYAYDTAVRQWIVAGAILPDLPVPPTELDLRIAFADLETYRMFSDAIVWRPVRYKMLFGNGADPENQMIFKVVRLPNATLSDGEIKTQIITAINAYFSIQYWDFGETFYWSELAAYIHQQLANIIGSIVPVPQFAAGAFGDGFEVSSRSDEVFISTAQVANIVMITSNTPGNLRIRQ